MSKFKFGKWMFILVMLVAGSVWCMEDKSKNVDKDQASRGTSTSTHNNAVNREEVDEQVSTEKNENSESSGSNGVNQKTYLDLIDEEIATLRAEQEASRQAMDQADANFQAWKEDAVRKYLDRCKKQNYNKRRKKAHNTANHGKKLTKNRNNAMLKPKSRNRSNKAKQDDNVQLQMDQPRSDVKSFIESVYKNLDKALLLGFGCFIVYGIIQYHICTNDNLEHWDDFSQTILKSKI